MLELSWNLYVWPHGDNGPQPRAVYTLTEARVVIEDFRGKYNSIRPHRSFGLLTPLEFAGQETDPETCRINLQGMSTTRATPSLRSSLDTLYNLTLIIH